MQFSPVRRPGESLSSFRFRYSLFSIKCGIGFALALATLMAVHPDANRSALPFVVMFLYFGLPIGLGMCILSAFGFFVGSMFTRQAEKHPFVSRLWPRIQFVLGALILIPASLFALYWLFRGLSTMETQALARGGIWLITPQSHPLFFWASLIGWGSIGFGLPIAMYRRAKRIFSA